MVGAALRHQWHRHGLGLAGPIVWQLKVGASLLHLAQDFSIQAIKFTVGTVNVDPS